MGKLVKVIGAGISGLAAATVLGKKGYSVTVFEKNANVGGRARIIEQAGYVFDMGPSWYWMPDIFENYFSLFGKKVQDYYELKLLDPSFTIYYGKGDQIDIPASVEGLYEVVEKEEPGGANKLRAFLEEAEVKYRLAVNELIYLPSASFTEFLKPSVFKNIGKLSILTSYHKHVRKYFQNPRIIQLLEFPILFLGANSKKTPALFSLMNHAAFNLSTWYPMGGFSKVTEGMHKLAMEMGVEIRTSEPIEEIRANGRGVEQIVTGKGSYACDGVVGASDYAHTEQLLEKKFRNYSDEYWEKKTFSPSSLIFYLGINKRVENLKHHNLFFDEALDDHTEQIYEKPEWPAKPLFYVCCPSKTDPSVAPEGHENLFILMPLAPGLEDNDLIREVYFDKIIKRIEHITGEEIRAHIDYKKSYCINDFKKDYNAYKGNAYGLANTLMQTAFFRPSLYNKHLKNLVYAGQLTVPGPGVPPALISGQIAAEQLIKVLK